MKACINKSGSSLRSEQIKDAQDILAYGFKDDVSYNPNIVLYQTDYKIPIKLYDQKYSASYGVTTKFISSHTTPIELGELLFDTSKNEYWLCIESYNVSGIHYEGKLGKCSRFIKWQAYDGTIQQIPVISRNATQYNNGEYSNENIVLGSDQVLLYTQLNEYTKLLDRGTLFFLDENKTKPSVYKLTKPDTVDYSYMGKGVMSMMLTESTYTPTKTELALGVCNYKVFHDVLPSTPTGPNEITDLSATISGNPRLKLGFSRTYIASFIDKDGNNLEWHTVDFEWDIISSFNIKTTVHQNKIDLLVNDDSLIGESFLLQLKHLDTVISQTEITIVEGF